MPHRDNSQYLKNNTAAALKESLEFFLEDSTFCQKNTKLALKKVLACFLDHSDILFPFMLLNHILVSKYEEGNRGEFLYYLELFVENINEANFSEQVVEYGSNIFSDDYWQICQFVITETFQENVVLEKPQVKNYIETSSNIKIALSEIQKISLDFYEEISVFVSAYLIIHSNRFIAGSSFPLIGLVGLSDNLDVENLVDLIVHETAHQYIYHLTVFDALCEGEGVYDSPLRKDPRPIEGIYHATFVLSRLIIFYSAAKKTSNHLSIEIIDDHLRENYKKFKDGYQVIMKNATLTNLGRQLIDSCKIEVEKRMVDFSI